MNTKPIYKSPAGRREIMAFYDAALARWPVAHQTFTIPTRHGDTFLIASGEKSAHPWCCYMGLHRMLFRGSGISSPTANTFGSMRLIFPASLAKAPKTDPPGMALTLPNGWRMFSTV